MMLVVQSQRPEALRRRFLTCTKGDSVGIIAVQLLTVTVEVLIEVLRLPRRVDEDVGLRNGWAGGPYLNVT